MHDHARSEEARYKTVTVVDQGVYSTTMGHSKNNFYRITLERRYSDGSDQSNLRSPRWNECVEHIRVFGTGPYLCRHDTAHFLDVARLAYIENLEHGLGLSQDRSMPLLCSMTLAATFNIRRHPPRTEQAPWRRRVF